MSNYTDAELIEFLKQHEEITVTELVYSFGKSAQYHAGRLSQLVNQGLLVRSGKVYRLIG